MHSHDDHSIPNHATNFMAGAVAGIIELCLMYPVDTVKTRMQSLTSEEGNQGMVRVLRKMVKEEGAFRPMRGMSVIAGVAGPAHAVYFASYEFVKSIAHRGWVTYGVAGTVATLLHDAVVNPAEVIKQRMQMAGSPYKSVSDCVRTVYRREGLVAFYRSYGTQLALNVPFQVVQFMAYEAMQDLTNRERKYKLWLNFLNGGVAGGVATIVTNPLDVCKTLINTQEKKVSGMIAAFRAVRSSSGLPGFFRGLTPRMLQQMASNAICWSIYEMFKHILV